ncbi:MAG TPA: N-acetyltransferase [Bacteroidales bacterium]|nr:MAG: hypothetical protein A2W98_13775 [Bacteroidetes bacterium GWF2_33_38]OFY73274.1 MAG: hypothetical protein A2265_09290 [Bacteroidetes bacterium RIFOXYA12_FULL_33_9]OFY90979.1 MAG: hypothetical protein A2236_03410 [Bacteroidetes bacterium RIFOXYA2_FULL_33_7]HBF89194.1 N-acetyltransferase [Bacteroidales bacterium]
MNLTIRELPSEKDIQHVREIVSSTGFFYDHEIDVAVELVQERVEKGIESGYYFIFADYEGKTIGYSCYGEIPCTTKSFDLYWIAVHNDFRDKGIGKKIFDETYNAIKKQNGRKIYIETSSREKYIPTQKFYDRCKCDLEARLKDYYDKDDDKLVYVKTVE